MKAKLILRALAWTTCAVILLACNFVSNLGQPAPLPTDVLPTITPVPPAVTTETPVPTQTSRPLPTATEEEPSCYRWDQVTTSMAGQVVCVYGVAYSHQGQSRIDFSPKPNTFFLIDTVYYYPNLEAGSCVVAEEMVEVFDGRIPFMTINGKLYNCEPWMLD